MNTKYAQLMGKSKDPIVKFIGIDVKKYSEQLEKKNKLRAQKQREAELNRKQKLSKVKIIRRNRSSESHKSQSPPKALVPSSPTQTVTFDFSVKDPKPPDYLLEKHEERELKEQLEVLKLVKQYFEITFHPFHKWYQTPYFKKALEITCFDQFSEDTSNIDYLEEDYSNCYNVPLLTIKNLGRYDCWEDMPPERWLEMCQKNQEEYDGTSPMYDYANDKFMWNYVNVQGFDKEKLKYKVKFFHTEKEVSRLSLLFRWENQEEFDYRKYLCEKRRNRVDQFILFTRYVDNVPAEIIAPLNF